MEDIGAFRVEEYGAPRGTGAFSTEEHGAFRTEEHVAPWKSEAHFAQLSVEHHKGQGRILQ